MTGMATVAGGVKHGTAVLSHAERSAAENTLAKLNKSMSTIGSHLGAASATVIGGVKAAGLGVSRLIQGHGSDTFMGGVRSSSTHALANIGNDTVVGGSSAIGRSLADAQAGHGAHGFTLNTDTISVKGATAEGIKALQPEGKTVGSHTITLSDKTTVTIAGLSKHDIGKLSH
jgi:hypothetical protein